MNELAVFKAELLAFTLGTIFGLSFGWLMGHAQGSHQAYRKAKRFLEMRD